MSKRNRARPLARTSLALGVTISALAGAVVTATPASAVNVCSWEVNDVIWDKYIHTVPITSCPTGHTKRTPNGAGLYNHFNNVGGTSVYWKNTQPGAQPQLVMGLIRDKWASLGWENSALGFPTTDELPANGGRFNHFEGGSIYWSSPTGANAIQGDIRNRWADLGWENSFLGFPTTDETTTPDTVGRYNHFQNGSIYWKDSLGPQVVHGLIRGFWADGGWEQGPLGYPISDERPAVLDPADRFTDFENGVALWDAQTNSVSRLPTAQAILPNEILNRTRDIITPVLQESDQEISIRSGLSFAGEPWDYYRDGSGLHNRLVRVNVPLEIHLPVVSNPTVDLTLYIEINLNGAGDAVVATLRDRSWTSSIPFDASFVVSHDDIRREMREAIDPWIGRENMVQAVPVRPLSVKVMRDNTVRAFVG